MMHRLSRTPSLIALLVLLSACGWHLRGSLNLPAGMEAVSIHADRTGQELAQELRQALIASGVEASLDDAGAKAWHLDILSETQQRREISISREVRTAEFGITLTVQWQLRNAAGDIVIAPESLSSQSVYRHDADNLAGKKREEARLLGDMRRFLAGQILRRVGYAQQSAGTGSTKP